MRKLIGILFIALGHFLCFAAEKSDNVKPDFAKIKQESTNKNSPFYYYKLLDEFLANDTIMTADDYKYFYYGTIFQEDYDPYRPTYDDVMLAEIEPLYYKSTHTRDELEKMLKYAMASLHDNPLDIVQLKNLVFVYEHKGKVNLAKIWKTKLNSLLKAIADSGTGINQDNAWYVVYPRHEFDFLNITGIAVESSEFLPPYYEKLNVKKKSDKDSDAYYFNIEKILEEYYRKHPSEAN